VTAGSKTHERTPSPAGAIEDSCRSQNAI